MDWRKAYLGILRGLATGLRLAGETARAEALEKLIVAIEAGRNVDAHMEAVAVAVASNEPNDWDGVVSRINELGDEFQQPA